MIGDNLRNYTWKNLMNMALEQVSSDTDKRQGSIIYDTLSPAINCLMVLVEQMRNVYLNTFIGTASGEYLDKRVEETGLVRIQATNAIKRVTIYDKDGNLVDLDLGTLITPKGNGTLLYSLIEKESVGVYKARCSTSGTIGNEYIGECEAISNLTNVGQIFMTDLLESARNEETDTELRLRHKESTGTKAFGGNIADYRALVGTELTTVGQMQVYSRTATDINIVLSVVDNDNNPMTEEQLHDIAEQLDPEEYAGQGQGIVPMGHHPIVLTPLELATDITMTVIPETGRSVAELTAAIETKVREYFTELRSNWATLGTFYDYTVRAYTSQIIARVSQVEGVVSVSNVTLNGQIVEYLEYTQSKATQQLPIIGNITINS